MTRYLDKRLSHQNRRPSAQLEILRGDLLRLSGFVTQLARCSDGALAALDIADQLDDIHRFLNRFEARCLQIQIAACENEFPEPSMDDSFEATGFPQQAWNSIRKDAKRANKLTNQLTLTLTKIRSGLGGLQEQAPVPEEIEQINQVIGNTVSGLAAEWNSNLG